MSERLDEWEAMLDAARSTDPDHGAADVTNLLLAYCLAAIPEERWRGAVKFARAQGFRSGVSA